MHRSSRADLLRALLNLAWTGAVVFGVPLLLARTFGYPLPRETPDWGKAFSTPLQLVDPHVIVNALACLGWVTWSIVVIYVLVDVIDLARGVGHRVRRVGPASVIAGKLVASIALILGLLRQQPAISVPTARPATVEQVITATPAMAVAPIDLRMASATHVALPAQPALQVPASAAATTTTYVVQRGDSLWRIAEQQLGDGFRWREIHELNRGLISNPDLICSGWILTLPDDVPLAAPETASTAAAPTAPAPTAASTDQRLPADTEVAPAAPADEATPDTTATPVPAPRPSDAATTALPETAIEYEQPPVIVDPNSPAPTSEASSPTMTNPLPQERPTSAETSERTRVSGLPLWLRALGFNSRTDYDAWVNAHPELRNAPAPSADAADFDRPTTSLAALAASTFAAGLVVAAVTRSLDRRRHRVLNRRPVHAPLPARDPALRPAEHTFRANTSGDPAHQLACIDTVLRYLSQALRGPSHTSPNLLLVRAAEAGVELLWESAPAGEVPARFVVDPAGSWLFPYPDDSDLEDLHFDLVGESPYSESLVTLGDTRDGPVLVNLSAFDAFDITGDRDAISAWLAAVEIELEAHSWAARVDSHNARTGQGDARIHTAIDIADGTAHPYVEIQDRNEDMAPAAWTLDVGHRAARLAHRDSDIALDVTPVGVDPDLARLGTLLLLEADFDPYQTHVDEEPDGGDPDALQDEDPGGLSSGVTTGGSDASTPTISSGPTSSPAADCASVTPAGAGPRPTGTLLMETKHDNAGLAPDTEAADELQSQPGLRVTLLGPPTVTGWTTQPKGNRADEIVVYLAAARPDSVHRDRLMEALWNGERVKPKALFNHLAAIRRHADDPEIIVTDNASYRLGQGVRSDWDEFRAVADRASDLGGRERLDCLRQALDLVQGKPFDFADGNYAWACGEGVVSHIEVTVTDLARVLARDAIDAGDSELAIFAGRKGLLACPWLLHMYGYIIEAHSLAGDHGLVEHTWREAVRVAGEEDLPELLVDSYEANRARPTPKL